MSCPLCLFDDDDYLRYESKKDYDKVSANTASWFHDVTKNQADRRMHVKGPQICQIIRWNNSFQNMYGMNRQQLTVWPGKSIFAKKSPQNGYFCVQESELPDFGRTWTSNGWHQVNCLGGPENFGVEHFKLAMWKVGGTKF